MTPRATSPIPLSSRRGPGVLISRDTCTASIARGTGSRRWKVRRRARRSNMASTESASVGGRGPIKDAERGWDPVCQLLGRREDTRTCTSLQRPCACFAPSMTSAYVGRSYSDPPLLTRADKGACSGAPPTRKAHTLDDGGGDDCKAEGGAQEAPHDELVPVEGVAFEDRRGCGQAWRRRYGLRLRGHGIGLPACRRWDGGHVRAWTVDIQQA